MTDDQSDDMHLSLSHDNTYLNDADSKDTIQQVKDIIEYKKQIGHLKPGCDHSLSYILPRCYPIAEDRTMDKYTVLSIILSFNDEYHYGGSDGAMYDYINVYINRDMLRTGFVEKNNTIVCEKYGNRFFYKYYTIDGNKFVYDMYHYRIN